MLSVLFTEIRDQVARKIRSDSKDMQKFESMAKCEHVVLDEIWYVILNKWGIGKVHALFENLIGRTSYSPWKPNEFGIYETSCYCLT